MTLAAAHSTPIQRGASSRVGQPAYIGRWCWVSGQLDERPLTITKTDMTGVDLTCRFNQLRKSGTARWRALASCADESIAYDAHVELALVEAPRHDKHGAGTPQLLVSIQKQRALYERCNDVTAAPEQRHGAPCAFVGSTYSLVDKPEIELKFTPAPAEGFVPFIDFTVSSTKSPLFSGSLSCGSGYPQCTLTVPKEKADQVGVERLVEGDVAVGFLDRDLKNLYQYDDAAEYVLVDFARAIYYKGNPLIEKHGLSGIVWTRLSCGSSSKD